MLCNLLNRIYIIHIHKSIMNDDIVYSVIIDNSIDEMVRLKMEQYYQYKYCLDYHDFAYEIRNDIRNKILNQFNLKFTTISSITDLIMEKIKKHTNDDDL